MKTLFKIPALLSILCHVTIYGLVVLMLNFHSKPSVTEENFVDLGYESFDQPPAPAQEVKRVVRSAPATAPRVEQTIPDESPKELQEKSGEVAGAQTEQTHTDLGSESNGTAADTPYYRIKPKYPRAALVSGKEGWVLFEIDITETGEVDNIRVIDGEQRNLFLSEARRALAQWKYRPFIDPSGKVIRKVDHKVRVDFRLSEVSSGNSEARL